MDQKRRKKINKIVLSMFLSLAILTWFSKAIIGILYDFGYFTGHFQFGWWKPYINGEKIPDPNDHALIEALNKRPMMFWMFTQFTWLTTTVMIVFLMFRFFAFDDNVPGWLRWIRSQRTLSSIMIYEIIIAILFWLAISVANAGYTTKGFLKIWELVVTIIVHAVLPALFTIYGVIFLIYDQKASLLREGFVLKGLLWPVIYSIYYVVIALSWYDPYPLTNFNGQFAISLIKVIGAVFATYTLIGLMAIGHNFILLRYNKTYNPALDNDALVQREKNVQRIALKAGRMFIHKNKAFHHSLTKLHQEIHNLEKQYNKNKRKRKHFWFFKFKNRNKKIKNK